MNFFSFPQAHPGCAHASRALAALAILLLCACAGGPRSEGQAVIHGTQNTGTEGLLRVREANGGVHIRGTLMGLAPGPYALYVGQSASCRPARAADHLAGPLLLFRADNNGSAKIDLITSELHPTQGRNAVLGRSLVVEQAFAGESENPQVSMAACGAVKD
jgi:hypothetical protein